MSSWYNPTAPYPPYGTVARTANLESRPKYYVKIDPQQAQDITVIFFGHR